MKDSLIYYSVGALLYCPANNESIVQSIVSGRFKTKYSLALCLEDTIADDCIKEAEEKLIASLQAIYEKKKTADFYLPKIFIRVRCPEQIQSLFDRFGDANELVTGFIIPKFALDNADVYINTMIQLNKTVNRTIYMMPIFESPTLIHLQSRYSILYALKEKLDSVEEFVLNIRVGGNDLCHMFGFRRHATESIHDIAPITNIFSDIITVFGMDYVISGPVWEYYSGKNWDLGLMAELKQDRLSGFTGKTAIYPNQIELINAAYKVSATDFADAKSILKWNDTSDKFVSGSVTKERMNEYKTHYNWAKRILFLSEYYGVNE